MTADVELRSELEPLSDYGLIEAAAALQPSAAPADPDAAMQHTLGSCLVRSMPGSGQVRYRLGERLVDRDREMAGTSAV